MSTFTKSFADGFKQVGHCIGEIVNAALLLVVYLIGVGLTSIAAKLVRKRFLATKIEPKSKTYWKELGLKRQPIEEHYRQF